VDNTRILDRDPSFYGKHLVRAVHNSEKIKKALYLADKVHKEQLRLDKKTPYIKHPIKVAALILENHPNLENLENIVCAALLHDVVEDSNGLIKHEDIVREFGENVAKIVKEVTDEDNPEISDKLTSQQYKAWLKERQIEGLTKISLGAQLIRIADKISNVIDMKSAKSSMQWKAKYTMFARKVHEELSYVNSPLINIFDKKIRQAEKIYVNRDLKQSSVVGIKGLKEQMIALYKSAAKAKRTISKTAEELKEELGEGVNFVPVPLKKPKRLLQKKDTSFAGDISKITDVARCSFVCDSYEKMLEVSKTLESKFKVKKRRDTIKSPFDNGLGFRGIAMYAEVDGHITEVAVNLKCICEVCNNGAHNLFKARRGILAKTIKENREMSNDEALKYDELSKQSTELYDNALTKYNESSKNKIKLFSEHFPNSKKKAEKKNITEKKFQLQTL
jgi:5'-deoxynucleotidase YfbR-like HD superfamily hydrolase